MSYPFNVTSLPNQMKSLDEKLGKTNPSTKEYIPSEFGKDCMDFYDFVGSLQTREKKKDWKNYQLFNGQYDFSEYEYVTKPFSEQFGEMPAQMRHFSIISPPIKTLYGEMKSIPLSYFCKAEDQNNKNEFMETKTKLLFGFVQQQIVSNLQAQGYQVEDMQAMMPEKIEDYMRKDYTAVVEQWGQSALQYEIKKNDIKAKLLEGFKDGLIAGKEFYLSTIINDAPLFRLLNPLYVFYDKSLDVEFIDEGDFAGLRPFLTPSEIIANWGKYLTPSQVQEVLEYGSFGRRQTWNNSTGPESIQFDTENRDMLFTDHIFSTNNLNDMFGSLFTDQSTVRLGRLPVTIVFWKSKRKIGYLHYFDETGVEQVMLVDENYKEQEEQGEWIEWDWVNQVWEGTKIGTNIYLNIRPLNYQGVSLNKIYECRLPITGGLYNARNSKPTSLLDEMKPYQEAYNIYMYKLEQDFNSEMGKVLLMSLRHIPNRKGWNEKTWLWYLKAMKIAWVDDSAENLKGQSGINQFTAMDMSLGDAIQRKIEVLEWLKEQCNYIAGISPQRLGETQATETLGGVERSVRQSATQSELYFQQHQRICQRALTNHLNVCQLAYHEGADLSFFQDDMSRAFVQIDGGKFELADLGVFITDGVEDYRILNALRSMAQPAMQNGADLADVAELETTSSISEIKEILKKVKQERLKQMQSEQALEQQAIQSKEQMFKKQMQNENMNKQLDRETQIEIAEIRASGNALIGTENADANNDGTIDILEMTRVALEQSQQAYDQALGLKQHNLDQKQQSLDERKQSLEEKRLTVEKQLKEKEIAQKDRADRMKLRIARAKPKPKPAKK